jgi:methylene-fatty-acyl-phospholipid synthase
MVLPIDLYTLVDTSKSSLDSLLIALLSITIYPLVWNIIARNGAFTPNLSLLFRPNQISEEYRNKTITRIFGGNPYYGCYFLAIMMFGSGLLRDHLCVRLKLHWLNSKLK